jgi:tRNA (guanine-N7-)-methyltransferase
MGAKRKLQRFAEIKTFSNTFEFQNDLKGRWNQEFFKNSNPITLELGCGRGEYTLELASRFPERNFIGVDIKGARLWRGAKTALENGLTNVAFLRIFIDHIPDFFAPDEVSEIWITFPDPYPKPKRVNKRLTSSPFLARYRAILTKNGLIHFKTDDDGLCQFTLKTLEQEKATISQLVEDIYALPEIPEILSIKTTYEQKHLEKGLKIKYLCCTL